MALTLIESRGVFMLALFSSDPSELGLATLVKLVLTNVVKVLSLCKLHSIQCLFEQLTHASCPIPATHARVVLLYRGFAVIQD